MCMDIRSLALGLERFAVRNSSTILTAIAVTGTLTTAALTVRASFKAAELIQERNEEEDIHDLWMPTKEKVQLVWKVYIPPAAMALLTVASIIAANRIDARRAAIAAAAYSILEKGMEEYAEKVVEHIGPKKEQAVRDEIAQDRVNRAVADNREVLVVAGGDINCLDAYSGRVFTTSMETLLQAQHRINMKTRSSLYATLSDFYEWIGLEPTEMSDDVGWTADQILDLDISSAVVKDGRPWMVVSFKVKPIKV